MMKTIRIQQKLNRYIILLFLLSIAAIVRGQSYDRMVLANAGSDYSKGKFSAEFTFGEPIAGFIQNSFISAQQGFNAFYYMDNGNGTDLINQTNIVFNIYPNPFYNELTIEGNIQLEKSVQIEIQDITGKTVYLNNINKDINKIVIRDLNYLSKGYYVIKLTDSQNSFVHQIIKK